MNESREPLVFPPPVRLTPAASGALDVIRSLAAFAVMLGHCRAFFFVDYPHVEANLKGPLVSALYFLTGFGTQSVMVFFVLSGFLISSSVFRNLGRPTWSWRDYALDRACRLYVVLIPGLCLAFLWDSLGIHFFNQSRVYSAPLVGFGSNVPEANVNLTAFIGNLLFLQTRFTTTFGSDSPLWSLFNEGWYYVLFPALIVVILAARRRDIAALMTGLLLSAAAIWILNDRIVGFLVWLSGSAVALTARYLKLGRAATLYICAAGGLFAASLYASRSGSVFGSMTAVGLTFALLLHGVAQIDLRVGATPLALSRTFAGFSYSLYVLHFPLLLLLRATLISGTRWQPSALYLAYALAIATTVSLYAFLIARVTEGKTSVVRDYFRTRS